MAVKLVNMRVSAANLINTFQKPHSSELYTSAVHNGAHYKASQSTRRVCVSLTVLIQEHSDRDPAHVEPVQEVLDVLAGDGVSPVGLLIFHHSLSHGGHHIIVAVSDLNHSICETKTSEVCVCMFVSTGRTGR